MSRPGQAQEPQKFHMEDRPVTRFCPETAVLKPLGANTSRTEQRATNLAAQRLKVFTVLTLTVLTRIACHKARGSQPCGWRKFRNAFAPWPRGPAAIEHLPIIVWNMALKLLTARVSSLPWNWESHHPTWGRSIFNHRPAKCLLAQLSFSSGRGRWGRWNVGHGCVLRCSVGASDMLDHACHPYNVTNTALRLGACRHCSALGKLDCKDPEDWSAVAGQSSGGSRNVWRNEVLTRCFAFWFCCLWLYSLQNKRGGFGRLRLLCLYNRAVVYTVIPAFQTSRGGRGRVGA